LAQILVGVRQLHIHYKNYELLEQDGDRHD
jgi:hypothetical protein